MQAMWMVGLLIGARIAARATSVRGIALLLAVAEYAGAVAFGLPSIIPLTAVLATGYLVGGIGNAVQNVCQSTLIRARTPEDMRGRAFAGYGTAINAASTIGSVLGGLIVELVGARGCFALDAGLRIAAPVTTPEQQTARTA